MFEFSQDANLKLQRYPYIKNDKFQAWDSADEYIVNHIGENYHDLNKVLIIEDDFGAIGLSISAKEIYFVNDSILSTKGINNNLRINQRDTANFHFISPFASFPKDIDLIIIKLPKINKYLEFLLNKLNKVYSSNTPLIAGAKVKYLNPTIYDYCQAYFSTFTYSLSWKKSKIIMAKLSGIHDNKTFLNILADYNLTLCNYPNLFSSDKVDIGTRFLLDNLENIDLSANITKIIDVGSANGILGLTLQKALPQSKLWLTDISYSAYESAKATVKMSNLNPQTISLVIDNALDSFESDFADLIVMNPPFHDKHKVSIQTADLIFKDCYRVLKSKGQLLIVANRHLGYHKHLAKLFSQVQIITFNNKFTLLLASKD